MVSKSPPFVLFHNTSVISFEYILEKDKIQYRGSINKIIFDGYYKVFKEEEDLPIGDFPEIKEGDKIIVKGLFGLQNNDSVEIKNEVK